MSITFACTLHDQLVGSVSAHTGKILSQLGLTEAITCDNQCFQHLLPVALLSFVRFSVVGGH